jgi:hypothetical protein
LDEALKSTTLNSNHIFNSSSLNFFKIASLNFIWVFLIGASTLQAQTFRYHQYIKNSRVGTLSAQKTTDTTGTHYTIDSDVTINYGLGKTEVIYHAEAHYNKRDELIESKVRVEKNGKLRDYSETRKNKEGYLAQVDGEEIRLPWKEIEYSSLMLYVDEPYGIDSVFSEAHCKKNVLMHEGSGHYKVDVTGNKNINEYHYKKGVLQKAVLDHWLAAIHLKLISIDGENL